MSAVRRVSGQDTFEIDLGQLAAEGLLGRARRLLAAAEDEITPEQVGRAVVAVMRACKQRHVDGRPLVWNAYTIFLSLDDHETLRPLERALHEGLLGAVTQERARLRADMVGPVELRLRCDREAPLARGRLVVRARFEPGRLDEIVAGDLTIRAPEPAAAVEPTRRVAEQSGRLRLRWLDQTQALPLGQTLLLGRPHPSPPAGFVPLLGADSRCNRVQLQIVADAEIVTFTRPPDANPVQVDGALLAPGARLVVQHLPVTVVLSGGALTLRVERA